MKKKLKEIPEFKNEDTQSEALRVLRELHIDALIVIGGNGSQAAAHACHKEGYRLSA